MSEKSQAGLPYGATSLTAADVESPTKMAAYFEDAQPIWTPGSSSAYPCTKNAAQQEPNRRLQALRVAIMRSQ